MFSLVGTDDTVGTFPERSFKRHCRRGDGHMEALEERLLLYRRCPFCFGVGLLGEGKTLGNGLRIVIPKHRLDFGGKVAE